MNYETIEFRLEAGVARLTLNRPERLNAFNVQDSASGSLGDGNIGLEELSSATGGSFFPGTSPPPTLTQYPELLYMLDIPLSAIRADGSSHQLKVVVSPPANHIRARESFVAPSSAK